MTWCGNSGGRWATVVGVAVVAAAREDGGFEKIEREERGSREREC